MTTRKRLFALGTIVAGWVILSLSANSYAGIVPSAVSDPPVPEGSNYRYVYQVELAPGTQVNPGDFFTIYDFSGLVPVSNLQPADWTFSSSDVGPTPTPFIGLPADDADVENLTWTYAGSSSIVAGSNGTLLGFFSALSSNNIPSYDFFTSISHRTSDGEAVYVLTSTKVPHGESDDGGDDDGGVNDVPEPATLAMLALGLPVLGVCRLVRRRKSPGTPQA